MKIITTVKEMQDFSTGQRVLGKRISLVPTMGYLHDGHLSLLREGRRHGDILVMSLFVNPLQFGPKEDLAKYPRDFDKDKKLAESAGTDVIFYPDPEQMYPGTFKTEVEVTGISDVLCGKTRPGHFKGVATVVLKLFNIIMPHIALFGEKDFQQLTIIKQMVQDLNMAVEIIGMPTVRESDGIAMSSRNTYLSKEQRTGALSISRGMHKAASSFKDGNEDSTELVSIIKNEITRAGLREDYIDIVDDKTLTPIAKAGINSRIVVAAFAGCTRLIDNISLKQ